MKTNLTQKAGNLFLVFTFLISLFYTNITPVYAMDTPTHISPANHFVATPSTTPPLAIPEFKWSAVSGATVYHLQVSNNSAFTSFAVDITTVATTFSILDSRPFTDGKWFWRVRVEQPTVSPYSNATDFTKQWGSAANKPAVISPADGATLDFYNSPAFSWNPVVGAATYQFQVYINPGGWGTPIYDINTLATSYQPLMKFVNSTSYYWRVVPMDVGDHQGTPSDERRFTANYNFIPDLLEPAIGATPVFTPTFRWSAVRGAQFYRLQYGTSDTFDPQLTTTWDTPNTSFTPIEALPNDVDYFWRVRAQSGASVSDWNPPTLGRKFRKKWYIKPALLTPTLGYTDQRFPLFSWAPVPGASYYRVDLSPDPNFTTIPDYGYTANTFYTPGNFSTAYSQTYWRVTPYDGSTNTGLHSDNGSFWSSGTSVAPQQVYPLFYYPPDSYLNFPGVTTNPHEDRTVPIPIFIWHRIYRPAGGPNPGEPYADAYRLEVDDDPLFESINWTVDTENTSATPTNSNPFAPVANKTYYWRVSPLIAGVVNGPVSQVWQTRFDSSKGLTPDAAGSTPRTIRPTAGFEYADTTPMLEWFPISGATAYDVQISTEQDFSSTVDTATVPYPVYAPTQGLAQRSLGATDFGVYYWRVRQSPSGAWSSTRRFQIAAQSSWRVTRTVGNAANQLQIGSDPAGDTSNASYDLTDLDVSQSSSNWYFGFHVPSAPTVNVTYALYLDTDHVTDKGATFDAFDRPSAYDITTVTGYEPEYAIYILQEAGVFNVNKVYIYKWNGTGWGTVTSLGSLGGGALNKNGTYVEIAVPNSNIGYQDSTGSYAISLLSLPAGGAGGKPQDSVPSDPNVPGTGAVSHFSNVTERLNLLAPPNNASGLDPTSYPSLLPYFWDWPSGGVPWAGVVEKAYLDQEFTTEVGSYVLTSGDNAGPESRANPSDYIQADNAFYWRVQPRYVAGSWYLGAWSQSSRLQRTGFVPQNLKTSVTFATPTFSWDRVEGAEAYEVQVDTDKNFPAPIFGTTVTKQTSFTPVITLPNGTYYWRVRVRRYGNVYNSWTDPLTTIFTLNLPIPALTSPAYGATVSSAPTLCWTPIVQNNTAGEPVLAAYRYLVQVSKDPSFSPVNIYDATNRSPSPSPYTEQNCWTPTIGYDDGPYYWRVAMTDGNVSPAPRLGNFSATGMFIKRYPQTTLVSPVNNSTSNGTPTFSWSPVFGAGGYRIEVSTSNLFPSPLTDAAWTDSVRYTPTFNYPNSATTKYYWRIAIGDRAGKVGPFNSFAVTISSPAVTKTFISTAAHDGYVLESLENSSKGGWMNSTLANFNLGDDAAKRQYRDVLSFGTGYNSAIPANAVINAITLKFKRYGYVGGTTQMTTFQGVFVDIKTGYFGNVLALELKDFEALASKTLGPVTPVVTGTNVYNIGLMNAKDFINRSPTVGQGFTQIRLRFKLDDNNDTVANYLSLFSGNAPNAADRPQLIITYTP